MARILLPKAFAMENASANRAFLLLRYTLIITTAYLLLVEGRFTLPPLGTVLIIVAALASNVVIAQLPARYTNSPTFGLAVIIADTLWITGALLHSGHFNAEFFYLYFFVLLLAAIGENLQMIVVGAIVVCVSYVYLLRANGGNWSMWSSPSLIRIPFLFAAATFYGHLVERTRSERRRAEIVETERNQAQSALYATTERLREEAAGSAALVRVGQELISSLDTPVLLDHLCQLTAEELGSDASQTFLWQQEQEAYVLVAASGLAPHEQELIRTLQVPRADMTVVLSRLQQNDVIEVGRRADPRFQGALLPPHDSSSQVFLALRRGRQIIGVQVASWRGQALPFTPRRRRIAHGIAQLASMALANARLVEELEHANRLKSDFVSAVSHELRTPLNLIIGYTDILLEGGFGPLLPEQSATLQTVGKSSRDLLDMIEATLDLSGMEAQRVTLDVREIRVGSFVAEINAEVAAWGSKPDVSVVWDVPPDQSPLFTDSVKLKMVLKNLISNALKFTEHGSVTVGVHAHDDGVELCVRDTGIGISPEDQRIIFEPFRQADRSVASCYGGVGLGLHIVRRLLDLLGGTIAVESTLGEGSTFRVWVPSQESPQLAAAPPVSEDLEEPPRRASAR